MRKWVWMWWKGSRLYSVKAGHSFNIEMTLGRLHHYTSLQIYKLQQPTPPTVRGWDRATNVVDWAERGEELEGCIRYGVVYTKDIFWKRRRRKNWATELIRPGSKILDSKSSRKTIGPCRPGTIWQSTQQQQLAQSCHLWAGLVRHCCGKRCWLLKFILL